MRDTPRVVYISHDIPIRKDGLGWCVRCCAGEVEIATHCPGVPLTDEQREDITQDYRDYRLPQGWTTPGPVEYRRRRRTYG